MAVLTLNEAARIERCLRSATFADQWLVADSGSTDDTCQRAAALGADVHVFADWQGFAQQRNRLLPFIRTDYVLWLDADEVIPDSLRDEILALLQTRPEPFVGRIAWLEHAFGRPLTHFQRRGLPRLFPVAELVGFEGVVHEGPLLKRRLPVVELRAPLHHHSRETVYDSLASWRSTRNWVPPSGPSAANAAGCCGVSLRPARCSFACMCFGVALPEGGLASCSAC